MRFLLAILAIESAITLYMGYLTVAMLGIEGYRFLAVLPAGGVFFSGMTVWDLVGDLREKLAELEPEVPDGKKPLDDWDRERI